MKNYELLLRQNSYSLDLETFKNIPFPECEKHKDFLSWLCYYEKTEIVKYCLEHSKYKSLIDKENLLNQYCFDMSLDKNNTELLEYFLEKNYFTKTDIINSLDYFFFGKVDFKYLPDITEENVKIFGNKAIYHVNPKGLNLALKNGFEQKDIQVEDVFFCFKNHVDLKQKQKVLKILKDKLEVDTILGKDNDIFLKGLEDVNASHQFFEDIIPLLFSAQTIDKMIKNHFWIMMKMVKEESKTQSNYLQKIILLDYPDNFSLEDLQKIKKFHRDFYREIEKVKLYAKLEQKPASFKLSEKKKKI